MNRVDGARWRWIGVCFIPWLAALNLVWETAHLPLYTLWREAAAGYLAFSVVHCTAGDVFIGTSALLLSLMLMPRAAAGRLTASVSLLALAYTAFSEWMNTAISMKWAYAELMPVLQVGPWGLGISPLLQALLVPALALRLAGKYVMRETA